MGMNHRLTDPATVRAFVTGGKAFFTLLSKKSETRFTYRVRSSEDGQVFFVSVLCGTDNTTNYKYLGLLRNEGATYVHSPKGKFKEDSPSVAAFKWFWGWIVQRGALPEQLEFWHEGKCGRCGRMLTVPGSIASGFGPECITYIAEAA